MSKQSYWPSLWQCWHDTGLIPNTAKVNSQCFFWVNPDRSRHIVCCNLTCGRKDGWTACITCTVYLFVKNWKKIHKKILIYLIITTKCQVAFIQSFHTKTHCKHVPPPRLNRPRQNLSCLSNIRVFHWSHTSSWPILNTWSIGAFIVWSSENQLLIHSKVQGQWQQH